MSPILATIGLCPYVVSFQENYYLGKNFGVEQSIQLQSNLKRRFLAGLIDYGIMFGFFYAYLFTYGTPNDEGGYSVSGLAAFPIPIMWFLLMIVTEQTLGATIGNGIAGLRPLTLSGNKPGMMQSFKRHLLDMVDMFLFGLVALLR